MTDALDRMAAAHGIVRTYRALDGTTARASDEAVKVLVSILGGEEGGAAFHCFSKKSMKRPFRKPCFV
ncbi:hypothetical protein [Chelativorans alearense]|uniref:hypothetical protein n=1 Tax=Chelativorans alearense TaxID=2681495 RepID=UPI0013D040A7|nr:hypothetical protein [Chelativorans alearense]